MRVRKKCTECTQLKLMSDFTNSSETPDSKTGICTSCLGEIEYREYNSKINHKPLKIEKMATLAEKRKAAEEAAKTAGTAAPKTAAPVALKKETPAPKVGETTGEGHTVVGEKKEPGKRGRKAAPERPIEQLDLETGTIVIAVHQTVAEAAAAVGTSEAYLKDALNGWAKSAGKHKWRYEGEEIFVRPKKESVAKAEKTFKPEDKPVPGDLDYDPDTAEEELAPEEEENLDNIYEGEESEEEISPEE